MRTKFTNYHAKDMALNRRKYVSKVVPPEKGKGSYNRKKEQDRANKTDNDKS